MKKRLSLLTVALLSWFVSHSQIKKLSLADVITLAMSQSPRYRLAQTQKEISYYQYLTYKSNFNPQISLYGNAPVYNKEYFGVRQPDGTIKFQSISQNNASVGFGLSQRIPFTGGEVSVNSDFTRFDDFRYKTKQYNGTPFYVRLIQPLFSFNDLKWSRKIEPLKYEESKRTYVQEMENISQQSVTLYFNVLDAQSNIDIASFNLANGIRNYEIEKKRIDLGTTTEDKLLQLEMQVLTNQQNLEKARYDFQIAQLTLNTFIGIKDNMEFEVSAPQNISTFNVDITRAIEFARKYRTEFIAFERKKLEAQRNLAQAKAVRQQVTLTASYGLNNIGNNIGEIYQNPKDQQRFNIGFNIPIVDWGRRKAMYNTMIANEKLTSFNIELEESVLVQEIITLVKNFDRLKSNIALAQKADTVAQRRYDISNKLYQIGRVTITELNFAQNEKDYAHRNYVATLRQYWDSYYLLRRITLFDFEKNVPLFQDQ
jgi:outer membrane protein TolC